jgi:DNA-binding transcriptional MerR regulator
MDGSSSSLLQIGEFARLANTNLRTLRYYEELGLLKPARRSDGGFRFYRASQVDRMRAIQQLQTLGLSLEQIAGTLAPPAGNGNGREHVANLRGLLDRQAGLVERRIGELKSELSDIDEARQQLAKCATCTLGFSAVKCDPCPVTRQVLPPMLRALL